MSEHPLVVPDDEPPPSPSAGPHPAVDLALRLALGARGESVVKFRHEMHERRQARVNHAWTAAVDDSGLDAEELLTQINGDERLADLFAATMDSALKTRWQAKLRALGMVLAAGVTGDSDTRVDDAEALGRALEGLEAPHVRVLAALGEAKRINPGQPHGLAAWIAQYWPNTALTSGEIAAYLTARGLVVDPFYANGVLELSPLGHRVLALVRQAKRAELGLPGEPPALDPRR